MFLVINPLFRLVFGNSILSNYWNNFLFALIMLFLYYFVFKALFKKPLQNSLPEPKLSWQMV